MTYPFMMTSNQHPSRHYEKSFPRTSYHLYQERLNRKEKNIRVVGVVFRKRQMFSSDINRSR